MPPDAFEDLGDAGMWVSRQPVTPLNARTLNDLPRELRDQGVELRLVERLTPLRDLWSSTLHASGVRLRDAQGWT